MALTITYSPQGCLPPRDWLAERLRAFAPTGQDAGLPRQAESKPAIPEVIDVEANLVDLAAHDAAQERARREAEYAASQARTAQPMTYQPAARQGAQMVFPTTNPGRILSLYA